MGVKTPEMAARRRPPSVSRQSTAFGLGRRPLLDGFLVPGSTAATDVLTFGALALPARRSRAKRRGRRHTEDSRRQTDLGFRSWRLVLRRRWGVRLRLGLRLRLRYRLHMSLGLRLGVLRLILRSCRRIGLMRMALVALTGGVSLLGGVAALSGAVVGAALAVVTLLIVTLAIGAAVIVALVAAILALIGRPLAILRSLLTGLIVVRLTALLLKAGVQDSIVVIGVLEIVFGQDAITGRAGIARHHEKLFHELLRVAARTTAAAVVIGIATATPAAAATATTAAAARTGFAAVTAALTALHIIVLFIHQNEWTLLNAIFPFETSALNGWRGEVSATTARCILGGCS